MTDALVDVKNGNGNRRILSATNELTAPLAYEINEIVVAYESRLSTVRQTEETNRQLMSDYILNKVIDDPHIAVHIKSYPDRLFGNIDVILNLFILKNRYPVNEDISCLLCGLNALDLQSKLV